MKTNNLHSRIYRSRGWFGAENLYIKRDDELAGQVPGNKARKYQSLLAWCRSQGIEHVVAADSEQSNNLAALAAVLRENGFPCAFFMLRQDIPELVGNVLLTSLVQPDEAIVLDRRQWKQVSQLMQRYCSEKMAGRKVLTLPEGAFHPASLPGTMHLADDILRNEQESGLRFSHLFVDSGSGLYSAGLLLGLMEKGELADRQVVVTLIAGNEEEYRSRFDTISSWHKAVAFPEENVKFVRPPYARSYGSVNATVLQTLMAIARAEGIVADPVYSVKHFLAAKEYIRKNSCPVPLVVHSGSALDIMGFQQQLAELLQQ